jgi:hypothetical protein
VILLPLLGLACGTPGGPTVVADKTAANAGLVADLLDRLDQDSRRAAEARTARIARLAEVNAELRAAYVFDKELTRKAEGGATLSLIPEIEAWGRRTSEIFQDTEATRVERNEEILEHYESLKPRTDALRSVAQSLSELAKEDSAEDRIRFLVGFSREVYSEMEDDLEENEHASALLDEALGRADDAEEREDAEPEARATGDEDGEDPS